MGTNNLRLKRLKPFDLFCLGLPHCCMSVLCCWHARILAPQVEVGISDDILEYQKVLSVITPGSLPRRRQAASGGTLGNSTDNVTWYYRMG